MVRTRHVETFNPQHELAIGREGSSRTLMSLAFGTGWLAPSLGLGTLEGVQVWSEAQDSLGYVEDKLSKGDGK